MEYKILISEAAAADITNAIGWYEQQRIGLGYQYELSLEAAITFLQRHPLSCAQKYKDVRVKYLKRFPYGVHYELEKTTVKVVAVFHTSRSPLRWDERSGA